MKTSKALIFILLLLLSACSGKSADIDDDYITLSLLPGWKITSQSAASSGIAYSFEYVNKEAIVNIGFLSLGFKDKELFKAWALSTYGVDPTTDMFLIGEDGNRLSYGGKLKGQKAASVFVFDVESGDVSVLTMIGDLKKASNFAQKVWVKNSKLVFFIAK